MEIRGRDRSAPVLLLLHGGAERPLFRSFDPSADPRALTVERHLADLDAVMDHLRSTPGVREVTQLGHSWGGALG